MDRMPSSEFRRRYATLTSPTVVTVNGHAIGTWTPDPHHPHDPANYGGVSWNIDTGEIARYDTPDLPGFNSRPFTPVPKVRGQR